MDYQDPDIELSEKIKRLENDPEEFEIILAEYEYVQMTVYQEILNELAISPTISGINKYRILSLLFSYSDDKKSVESLVSSYIPVTPVIEFKVIEWLLTFDNTDTYLPRLYKYLSNNDLDEKVRYSQLMGLKKYKYVVLEGVKYFATQKISPRYKVLTSQFILETDTQSDAIFSALFTIAQDSTIAYNIRADAADAIHHYAKDSQTQEKAFAVLQELGGKNKHIYDNQQNVHNVDISGLLDIISKETSDMIPYDQIVFILRKKEDLKVNSSLGRIVLDAATYGKDKYTSEQIMSRIWAHIQKSQFKEALEKRMIEELQDMADTCSSGHVYRLLNVISGFENDGLRISYEDQIVANFTGRMNARLRNIDDQELRDDIIAQMPVSVQTIHDIDVRIRGKKFQKFFARESPKVIEELLKEFVPQFLPEEKFYLAIHMAISSYEG